MGKKGNGGDKTLFCVFVLRSRPEIGRSCVFYIWKRMLKTFIDFFAQHFFDFPKQLYHFTFLAEPVVVALEHWSCHPKISEFNRPARVHQAVPGDAG